MQNIKLKIFAGGLAALSLIAPQTATGQADSVGVLSYGTRLAPVVVAGALLSYGILSHTVEPFESIDRAVNDWALRANRHTKVDDYLQYAPAVAVFGFDLCGVKAKHNLRDRAFVTAGSYLLSTLAVQAVKHTVSVARPDGAADNSLPSGHTATAFTGAHILFREYGATRPWIGIAGYAAATSTGIMRVMNRRHWLGDVAAGAGTAIACVEASYLLLPVFRKIIKASDNVAVAPIAGGGYVGAGLVCWF
ncbi:MAG: phosphatase PAP2 family protein [Tannerellaceae bacterium]|jgi:membrane-associated phospholipid phosphatase|nr:phosphatase PAP2 family protein [Tannerellaceae bacterium]